MDDGDMMCHPILVLPFLQDFDVANARVGAERNPLKTEVIHCVNDLDAAQWRIRDVQNMAQVTTVTECKHFANNLPGHPCSSWMFSSSRSKGDTGLRRTDSFAKSPRKANASHNQTAPNERDPTVRDFDGCRDSNEQLVREAMSSSSGIAVSVSESPWSWSPGPQSRRGTCPQ